MSRSYPECKNEYVTIQLTRPMAANEASIYRWQSIWSALCIAFCTLWSPLPQAANARPDPLVASGKQFARIVCSQCHVVTPDQEFPPELNVSAPPFEEIANRHTTSEQALERFISKTHWDGETVPITMPTPELTRQQIIAVAHYIMSLRKR